MALPLQERTVGIDVAKEWLDVAVDDESVHRIANTAAAISEWLESLAGTLRLGVESTGRYHELVAGLAFAAGHAVHVISPFRLMRYRDAVGQRAKTDHHDARLIRRYLISEHWHLPLWQPPEAGSQALWQLLKQRAALVRSEVQLRQSLKEVAMPELDELFSGFKSSVAALDRKIREAVRHAGWQADLERLKAIPGIGPLTAAGLLAAYRRGRFQTEDRFVAYLGLDVRVRDSGQRRGRRHLSKQGEPELRRLLFNAAMAACRQGRWQRYYQALQARGMANIPALIALARKLVRLAFTLLHRQSTFDRQRWEACA